MHLALGASRTNWATAEDWVWAMANIRVESRGSSVAQAGAGVCMCFSKTRRACYSCCTVSKPPAVGVDDDVDDDDDVVDDDGRGRETCGYPSKVPCGMLAMPCVVRQADERGVAEAVENGRMQHR